MKIQRDVGIIHFVGIGGIGMSGIAEVMHTLGYSVQGSDLAEGPNVERLRERGIIVSVGHAGDNLGEAKIVVVSSAVKEDNPEVAEARTRFLPIVRRAEMLAELMRFKTSIAIGGTHGKTTTTSLVAALIDGAGLDPTVINGGIINAYGTNARIGEGEYMVVESDESDGTFVKLPADIAVVTNIDPEHLDHYGDFDTLREAFLTFVENVPFYGFAVMCMDHPEVQALIGRIKDRRVITYGTSPQAEVRMEDLHFKQGDSLFDIAHADRQTGEVTLYEGFRLPMPGLHNASNAAAAIAVALQIGLDMEGVRKSLAEFGGVKRRFTKTGIWRGVAIFDDYGHHPVEISAVLQAAREVTQARVIAMVQPHRYTRLDSLFEDFCTCFNDADVVIVAPVYEAGEEPIEGADRDHLAKGLISRGHRHVLTIDGEADLAERVSEVASAGDIVICLGAGTSSQWANRLPKALEQLKPGAE